MAGLPTSGSSLPGPSLPSRAADRVLDLVREIPAGRVTSYGAIARLTNLPAVLVGGVLARALTGDEPWWRVVGADGALRTYARDPRIGEEQRHRLLAEGIAFDDLGRVRMDLAADEL